MSYTHLVLEGFIDLTLSVESERNQSYDPLSCSYAQTSAQQQTVTTRLVTEWSDQITITSLPLYAGTEWSCLTSSSFLSPPPEFTTVPQHNSSLVPCLSLWQVRWAAILEPNLLLDSPGHCHRADNHHPLPKILQLHRGSSDQPHAVMMTCLQHEKEDRNKMDTVTRNVKHV